MNASVSTVPLDGAHAIVTGAARGIGYATCRRLLAAGAYVSMWDRHEEALRIAVESLTEGGAAGDHIATAVVDVTDSTALSRAYEEGRSRFGAVDVLINNAGHLAPGRLDDQEIDVWRTTIAVNVDAVIALSRLVIPEMYRRRRGHIVNISSAAGAIGVPNLAVYSASKWAVWGFTEALRGEAREHNVLVSSVHPSYVATGMFAGARLRGLGNLIVPRLPDHDVVAEAIVEAALRRGRTRIMRPRSVRLAVLLRGILSDGAFNALIRLLGVWDSMSGWHGRRST